MSKPVLKLNPKALALALGILLGLDFLLHALLPTLGIEILWWRAEAAEILKKFYPGFDLTPIGALIALIWGFGAGALGGLLIAFLYNLLCVK